MNNVNVQISLTNLVQMDRHQADAHRAPIVNQEQNAEAARQEAARRIVAPMRPDQAEGKQIDPDAKREEEARRKRRRKAEAQKDGGPRREQTHASNGRGRIIDYQA